MMHVGFGPWTIAKTVWLSPWEVITWMHLQCCFQWGQKVDVFNFCFVQ